MLSKHVRSMKMIQRTFGFSGECKQTFQKSHFPGDSGRFSDVNSGFYVFLTGFEAFGKLWSPFWNVSGAFSLLRLPLEIETSGGTKTSFSMI